MSDESDDVCADIRNLTRLRTQRGYVFAEGHNYAIEEQKRAFASASACLIALVTAVHDGHPREELESISHDYLRWNAHFVAAVQASGEMVV